MQLCGEHRHSLPSKRLTKLELLRRTIPKEIAWPGVEPRIDVSALSPSGAQRAAAARGCDDLRAEL